MVKLFIDIELALAVTSADRTSVMIGEPPDQVMGVSSMLAPHAPCEPFGKRKTRQRRGRIMRRPTIH